jgi:hypothetical protein
VAELKTTPTKASVNSFLKTVDPERRADCEAIVDLMRTVTKEEPRMWGTSIVGFGVYTYKSGSQTAEWLLTGFSPRKQNLTVYLMDGFEGRDALPLLRFCASAPTPDPDRRPSSPAGRE